MKRIPGRETGRSGMLARREVLKVGGYSAVGLMLALSTRRGAFAQDAAPSLDNIKANLSTLRYGELNPNYVDAWPTTVAITKGYFKDVGIEKLESTLTEEYIPGLVGDSLDIAHGDTSGFLAAAEASNLPIKIISVFRQKERWIMAVAKGINTPEDLKGKKISGGPLDGRNTWVQRQLIMKMGLDPDKDVEFVPTSGGSNARQAALINGVIDAASVFPRHRAGIEAVGGKFIHDELFPAPQESIAGMGTWLSANEDTVYAWALADIRARQWIFDRANKDEAYKIMRDYGFDISPDFEAQYEEELGQLSPDGGFDSGEVMDTFIAQLKETGDVPADTDWRDHFEMKYVWAAQEALGLPKRPASL